MPLPGSRAHRIQPYAVIQTGASTQTFFLGDCLDVFRTLPPGHLSAIVTSPPYNLGVRYRSYDDTIPRRNYLAWTDRWIAAAREALSARGSLFLNVGAVPSDPWAAMDVAQTARQHFRLQNTIHWIKSIAIERDAVGTAVTLERDLAVGHYKPINSPRFVNDCHEFVFHFTPGGETPLDRTAIGVEYQDPSNIARWRSGGRNRRCRGNTWFVPYETIKYRDKDRPHPATFPAKLAEYCFRLHGRERLELAMDPFLGLGSAAMAAADMEIDFIGVELDEYYLEEAIRRVKATLNARGLFGLNRRRREKGPSFRKSSGPGAKRR